MRNEKPNVCTYDIMILWYHLPYEVDHTEYSSLWYSFPEVELRDDMVTQMQYHIEI